MAQSKFTSPLVVDMKADDSFCIVKDTSLFPDAGFIKVGAEIMYYPVKTTRSFDDLIRGYRGSLRMAHKAGERVVAVEIEDPVSEVYREIFERVGEDIELDDNGDLVINGKGDFSVVSGIDALAQRLRTTVRSVASHGIDKLGVDLRGKTDADIGTIIASVVAAVGRDPEVEAVDRNTITYELKEDAIYLSMSVRFVGMSDSFQFAYKINYRDQTIGQGGSL